MLDDLLDEALPPARRQDAATHFRSCPGCRAAWRTAICTRRLLGRLPREPMPEPLRQYLIESLRSRPCHPRRQPR